MPGRAHQPPLPERANVLLVGGGGREHAVAWHLRRSPRLGDLWLTDPANAGLVAELTAELLRLKDEAGDTWGTTCDVRVSIDLGLDVA